MENENEIAALLQQYKIHYPGESERTIPVQTFLKSFSGEQLFNRKNFTGHITASAYIIHPAKNSLLFLRHRAFNRWLQPGGHVDATDASLLHAALREAEEETGIAASSLTLITTPVFHIDSHPIPFNDKKNEPAHVHHDISFLFQCNTVEINFDKEESTAAKWVDFSELTNDDEYKLVLSKIIHNLDASEF